MRKRSIQAALSYLTAAVCLSSASAAYAQASQPSMYQQVMGTGGAAAPSRPQTLGAGESGMGRANSLASLPDPRAIAHLVQDLRGGAMNVVRNCNYSEYLDLADDLATSSGLLDPVEKGKAREYAVPVMDAVNMFTRPFQTEATRKQTQAETQTLALTLEQTCNTMRQADDENRQYEILARGRVNIGNAVQWLAENLKLEIFPPTVARQEQKARVRVDLDQMQGYFEPEESPKNDSTWSVMNATLRETMKMGAAYDTALTKLDEQLGRIEPELWLLAEYSDSLEVWTCPDGYPNPNRDDVQTRNGARVCGPATPERSVQLSTDIAYHDSHLRALEIKVMNQVMQVEAVRLLMNNHARKGDARIRYSAGSNY